MSDGLRTIQIPRANPVNAYTMGNIAKQLWPLARRVSANLVTNIRVYSCGFVFSPQNKTPRSFALGVDSFAPAHSVFGLPIHVAASRLVSFTEAAGRLRSIAPTLGGRHSKVSRT